MPSVDMTTSAPTTEHFVTLFDRHFLPAGLALLASLRRHAQPFRLWILCMDEQVEAQLRGLALPEVGILPLREVENEALLAVKPGRSVGEYCWTMTSFAIGYVLARLPAGDRVTYLDADLFFFSPPAQIFAEFDASGAAVLITEHAYAKGYDQSHRAGIYCVQFMAFTNNAAGWKVLQWWQTRCLEWCFARVEDGKFGDQKYLDDWPQRFGAAVHVLAKRALALGPWNTVRFPAQGAVGTLPVFFHFHGLRLVAADRVRLYWGYRISAAAQALYEQYLEVLAEVLVELRQSGIGEPPLLPENGGIKQGLLRTVLRCLGLAAYQSLSARALQR